MISMPHTITIVEDNNSFAQILSRQFNAHKSLHVVNVFHNKQNALVRLPEEPTDVVIVDLQLPDGTGIELVTELKRLMPTTIFIMCTSFDDEERIFAALQAGATGYIVKTDDIDNINTVVLEAISGGAPMSSSIALKVVSYFQKLPKGAAVLAELSARENEVLAMLARGMLYKEIALQLGIALDTLKKHCGSIYKKLEVTNKTEAILKYQQR
jgi:two-component system, NarL family, response regulator LiaR